MKRTSDFDTRLMMQYIGAVTLLGRIASHLPRGHQDRFGIEKAMRDANNILLFAESEIVFSPSSDGGFAAFERRTP